MRHAVALAAVASAFRAGAAAQAHATIHGGSGPGRTSRAPRCRDPPGLAEPGEVPQTAGSGRGSGPTERWV